MKASDIYGGARTTAVGTPAPASSTSSQTNTQVDTSGQNPQGNTVKQGKFSQSYGAITLLAIVGILVGLKFGLENNN